MLEFLDISPDITVHESEFKRLLGYPGNYVVSERVQDLMDETRRWYNENGSPWIYARHIESCALHGEQFLLDNKSFTSKRVAAQMRDAAADSVAVVVVSAGKNCEGRARQLWREEKPDEYFFMEVYGSAVVEHLIAQAAEKICSWADTNGMAALPRYSPGYPEWGITDQQALYDVIVQNKKHDFPEVLHVMHTGMLNPKKSLLTIFGLTKQREKVQGTTHLIPCANCSLGQCHYRRSAYERSLPQLEEVEKLRSDDDRTGGLHLESNAEYSFSRKALEKWSKERLRLQLNDDHSYDAVFRYQGTTCSNMGHALEFDYHVKIESPQTEYKIVHASCAPAPGDEGYTHMCQYGEDPDAFMVTVQDGMPLAGKPLNDILKWKREYNPSACYCQPSSREHKWGLVLEVLHYAIVQREKVKS